MSQPKNTSLQGKEEQEFSKELFKPMLASTSDAEKISRPIISYWSDALRRLARNRVALVSAIFIVFIALTGIVGPFLFPKTESGTAYENLQNPDFKNQDPTAGEQLLVTDDSWIAPADLIKDPFKADAPLLKPEDLKPVANLTTAIKPTVNGVTLTWDPIEGVTGYQLYRAVQTPDITDVNQYAKDASIRGLLVGTIANPAQYSVTDSSGLDPSEVYIFTVVPYVTSAETGEDIVAAEGTAIKADIMKSMKLSEVQQIKPDAQIGDVIKGRPLLFGTDSLGRDVLARTVQGTRIDFFLALLIPAISLLIGLTYGAISGLAGGKLDLVLMRVVEVLDTMPELLLFVLLQVALGKGLTSLIVALCAISWTGYARILRAEVLRLREIEFVQASRLLGAPLKNLIFRHIAPNLLGVIIVLASGHIPRIITTEAFLSLLGLGVEAPMASWGTVLQEAGERFQAHPLQFFLPASVMGLTLLAFFLLGDALRDAFDPKLRGRE